MLDLCTFLYLNHFSYLFAYKMLTLSTINKADCGDCPRRGDAMIVTRTRAQALIYWGPRLSANTSSTWLSHRGIECQQTSQKYSGETNPGLCLEDYRLACQADRADSDYFIIRNLPLFLANSTWTCLEQLLPNQIQSWVDLKEIFVGNF
jgi:hypothetical protein